MIRNSAVAALVLLLGFSPATSLEAATARHIDSRTIRLQAFFESYGCPEPFHIREYLRAADDNSIDYRLMPAISVRESTCGWNQRLNNHWGWDSARTGFKSVGHGIHFIAHQLANSHYYRGKTLNQKLHTYNPTSHVYVDEVRRLMSEIELDAR